MGHLPRERRITTRREIGWLLSGERARGGDLDLHWRPAAGELPRATCITPKFGHTSVERNLLRRRLRELLRKVLLSRPDHRDYLVRARPGAYERDFGELEADLTALAGRIAPGEDAP